MSTFGEIAEPGSRTFWEDWDEVSQEDNYTKLQWKKETEVPSKIETLLILEGKYLFDSIKNRKSYLEPINSVTEINMYVYKVRELNTYMCIIKDYELLLSSEIVELLYNYIQVADEVIAILMKPLVEYQTSENLSENCFIRRLSTKVQSKSLALKYSTLEQPNIISGVSAGVVCLREFLDKPASAIIFYGEHPETQDTSELQKLLQQLNIVYIPDSAGILNSNMYI